MMTSWAIVCDVWYLPPMNKKPDEDAITFANRVKAEIARQGGLVDLMWYVLVTKLEMNNHLFHTPKCSLFIHYYFVSLGTEISKEVKSNQSGKANNNRPLQNESKSNNQLNLKILRQSYYNRFLYNAQSYLLLTNISLTCYKCIFIQIGRLIFPYNTNKYDNK